jgi:hypothetical protein
LRYLTDPDWLAAIAAIISIIIVVIVYFAGKAKKSLSYEVLSENPLISIDNEIKGKLQILLDGKPIENVHLLLIRIINDGKVPITANDYERPVTLKFSKSSNILSAEHVGAEPANLVSKPTIHDGIVTLEPVLMNSGDLFTIKVLVGEYTGPVDVDGRIAGVKNICIGRKQGLTTRRRVLIASGAAIMLLGAVVLIKASLTDQLPPPPEILSVDADITNLKPNQETNIVAKVNGTGDLRFQWYAGPGQIEGSGPVARYSSPSVLNYSTEFVQVWVYVTDSWGRQTRAPGILSVSGTPQQPTPIKPKPRPSKELTPNGPKPR